MNLVGILSGCNKCKRDFFSKFLLLLLFVLVVFMARQNSTCHLAQKKHLKISVTRRIKLILNMHCFECELRMC